MVKRHSCFRFNVEKAVRFRSSAFKATLTFSNFQRKEEHLLTMMFFHSLDISTQQWVLFYLEIIMRTTKNWGFTNSEAELYMLAHAERTRKELERERKTTQGRLPRTAKTRQLKKG